MSTEQKSAVLFITLIQQYQMQAWISLGKIKNPTTDKTERNLEYAKLTIDMLDMLKKKTRGNLSEDETRLIEQTLSNLKLNYVEESGKKECSDEEQNKGSE